MEAEPAANTGADGPDDTGGPSVTLSESDIAGRSARRPHRNPFTRLARFSIHTRRWHAIDPAAGGRGDRNGEDMPGGRP